MDESVVLRFAQDLADNIYGQWTNAMRMTFRLEFECTPVLGCLLQLSVVLPDHVS